MSDDTPVDPNNKTFSNDENIVIISVIALGFIGPIVIYVLALDIPQIITAVLLGAAVSALVYRFLGGISEETNFTIGAFKLGGVMAALVGCAWFFNGQLVDQTMDLDAMFEPPRGSWYAFDRASGFPVEVKVGDLVNLPEPARSIWANSSLEVTKVGRENIDLARIDSENNTFPVGGIQTDEMKEYITVQSKPNEYEVTDYLYLIQNQNQKKEKKQKLTVLPFTIEVIEFSQNRSYYKLTSSVNDSVLIERDGITLRNAKIKEIEGTLYLIAVVEVNHQGDDKTHYAKFGLWKIAAEIQGKGE